MKAGNIIANPEKIGGVHVIDIQLANNCHHRKFLRGRAFTPLRFCCNLSLVWFSTLATSYSIEEYFYRGELLGISGARRSEKTIFSYLDGSSLSTAVG